MQIFLLCFWFYGNFHHCCKLFFWQFLPLFTGTISSMHNHFLIWQIQTLGFTFISWPCILKSLSGFALGFGAAILSLQRSLSTVAYFPSAICSCKIILQADNTHKTLTPNIHHKSHDFMNQPLYYHQKLMAPII